MNKIIEYTIFKAAQIFVLIVFPFAIYGELSIGKILSPCISLFVLLAFVQDFINQTLETKLNKRI